MGKAFDYVKREQEKYGEIYYSINNAISDISPFLDKNQLRDRKYTSRLPVLKKYIDKLGEIDSIESRDGILGFMNDDKNIRELENYKVQNMDAINQLERCSSCACLNCTAKCSFDSCLGCRRGAKIVSCDHEKINVVLHDDFILDLTNDRTGRAEKFKVLATLQDAELDRRYIIIEGLSSRDKYILYYYPGISEDTYGEIRDEQEFDFIVSTYEGIER